MVKFYMTKLNRFLLVVSFLVVFGAGILLGASLYINKDSGVTIGSSAVGRSGGISVMIDAGDRITVFKNLSDVNQTALSVLNAIGEENKDYNYQTKDYGDLGVLVSCSNFNTSSVW